MTRMPDDPRGPLFPVPAEDPYALEIVGDEVVGDGGFLHVRRLRLCNVHPDGTRSTEWVCDFVERKKGVDAVVVVVHRPGADGVDVLLRWGLRPAVVLGRPAERLPLAEAPRSLWFCEVVAGIVEVGERGDAAVRQRAVDEVWEEAGLRIAPSALVWLGSTFPSPGMTSERYLLWAVEVPPEAVAHLPPGDGSPMEEGARLEWVSLDEALARCLRGELEDAKTEVILRRLRDHLAAGPAAT